MPGYHPVVVPSRSYYLGSHDYGIDDSINKAEYFSNAVLEDTYDAAAKSRGRDASLLRSANAAIDSIYYRPYIIGTGSLYASRAPLYYPRYTYSGLYSSGLYDYGLYDSSYLFPRSHTLSLPGSSSVGPVGPSVSVSSPPEASAPAAEEKKAEEAESAPKGGSSVNIPLYYYAGGDPQNMGVSELRRRLRRTICKAKGNPNYYRMNLDD